MLFVASDLREYEGSYEHPLETTRCMSPYTHFMQKITAMGTYCRRISRAGSGEDWERKIAHRKMRL